jgi:hypothetical protein
MFSMNNLYIPVSQLLSLSCISKCSQGKQTDRQIDRHTVKKKNRSMSATTSDAMLRTRFVCYLYSFSLYRSSSSTMMMMGIPRCKRMAGGWYSTFGTHERSCWYVYMYVSCPVLMMMLLKWNVCCVGVVHYNETWEQREREGGKKLRRKT